MLPPQPKAYEVNAGAAGRLARRYRDCEAFVHGSTGSLYEYQGERPLRSLVHNFLWSFLERPYTSFLHDQIVECVGCPGWIRSI